MAAQPTRVVDAHVHLWDPARSDWYPYLTRPQARGAGDASRMCRRFDIHTYQAETASWNVEKLVIPFVPPVYARNLPSWLNTWPLAPS